MSLTVEYDTIKPQQLRNIDNTDTGAKIGSSYKVSGSTYKIVVDSKYVKIPKKIEMKIEGDLKGS